MRVDRRLTYPKSMTCLISFSMAASNMSASSKSSISSMSNVIAPRRLMVLQAPQIMLGPADNRNQEFLRSRQFLLA